MRKVLSLVLLATLCIFLSAGSVCAECGGCNEIETSSAIQPPTYSNGAIDFGKAYRITLKDYQKNGKEEDYYYDEDELLLFENITSEKAFDDYLYLMELCGIKNYSNLVRFSKIGNSIIITVLNS